jgi:hypothetical protein
MKQPRTGRNDLCPCGSGRKFKRCCEATQARQKGSRFLVVAVGAIVVTALVAILMSVMGEKSAAGPRKVWDPAHGHYHDVP